jgi:hypothetical protein
MLMFLRRDNTRTKYNTQSILNIIMAKSSKSGSKSKQSKSRQSKSQQEKEKRSKRSKTEEEVQVCDAIIKNGDNKGKRCGKKATCGDKCGTHNPDKPKRVSKSIKKGSPSYHIEAFKVIEGMDGEQVKALATYFHESFKASLGSGSFPQVSTMVKHLMTEPVVPEEPKTEKKKKESKKETKSKQRKKVVKAPSPVAASSDSSSDSDSDSESEEEDNEETHEGQKEAAEETQEDQKPKEEEVSDSDGNDSDSDSDSN